MTATGRDTPRRDDGANAPTTPIEVRAGQDARLTVAALREVLERVPRPAPPVPPATARPSAPFHLRWLGRRPATPKAQAARPGEIDALAAAVGGLPGVRRSSVALEDRGTGWGATWAGAVWVGPETDPVGTFRAVRAVLATGPSAFLHVVVVQELPDGARRTVTLCTPGV